MNKIILKGRLVRDPELKTGESGTEYCKFTVAVDRRVRKDQDKKTDFFDCTAFQNTGVAISKYFTKGKEILLEGRMESRKVQKDDENRTYWGVSVDTFEFCGSKGDGQADPEEKKDEQTGMTQVDTDELPF